MALTPFFWNSLLDDSYMRPSRLFDQHFGLELLPEDLFEPLAVPARRNNLYYRPWRTLASTQDVGSSVKADSDKFQISLDVQQFKPEEICVKTLDDQNAIVIEGKHEEKPDEHGFISRQFVRRYVLPQGHDVKQVASNLSSDGVLTITAPKMAIENKTERKIPIQSTGPVRAVKDKKDGGDSKK